MHELSIALSMVEVAAEEAQRREASRVTAIHLKLGPLSGVVKAALRSAYELACEGSPLAGSRLVIEDAPVIVFCPTCQARRPVASIHRICCQSCGTPTPDIVSGREMEVTALEIVD